MNLRKLVADGFEVPVRVELEYVVLVPVTIRNWDKDYDAVVSTRGYTGLNPGLVWPEQTMGSVLFGLSDVCYMDKLLRGRASVCYGIMTPDERTELGCLYVYRTRKLGYDAEIYCWVRRKEAEEGLRERVYEFAEAWVPDVWPFGRTTWPGWKIPWPEWYALPDKAPENWPGNPPSHALLPRRLVPDSFQIPTKVEKKRFVLVPLHLSMDTVAKHHEAIMSSVDHLNASFPPSGDWPRGKRFEDAVVDVGSLHFHWYSRGAFAYSLRDPGDARALGCISIEPTRKVGYQAEVCSWVRESELRSGLDEEVNEFTHAWIQSQWPFDRVAWPGRDFNWAAWGAMPEYELDPV